MTQPLVSVCIPTFNHADYIQDCLLSVLGQTVNGDIEILVGDDCSTDRTSENIKEIMTCHPGKIRYLYQKTNVGPFENLKSLVREASGKFIAHLDGDDFWTPGKLRAQLEFLGRNQDCVACYSNAWVVSRDLCPMGIFNNRLPDRFNLSDLLVKGNFLNHSSLVYRATHKNCVLNLPDRFIDYQIHLGLTMHGAVGYLNVAYVVYRHASSQSMIQNSGDQVRILYLQALLFAFDAGGIESKLRADALSNFWARIVKDGASKFRFRWTMQWAKELQKNPTSSFRKIMIRGLIQGLIMLWHAAQFRILTRLLSNEKLRVFNRR